MSIFAGAERRIGKGKEGEPVKPGLAPQELAESIDRAAKALAWTSVAPMLSKVYDDICH